MGEDRCTYRNCSRKASFVTESLARCSYHLMLEADKERRSALYWPTGWADDERRQRIQAKAEMLRQQMLNPDWSRGETPEDQRQIRDEALAVLREYVSKLR